MANKITNKEITASANAPSNIAIVKYWGKKGIQEPVNPSLSFTLSKAQTHTTIKYINNNKPLRISFLFEGKRKTSFLPKLNTLTNRLSTYLPFLKNGLLTIESANTFPHSSGIASSASSMASIVNALLQIQNKLKPDKSNKNEAELKSEMARFGSGSACRSTMNGWVLWGKTPLINESSNRYGIAVNDKVHPVFNDLQDSILVIRKGAKAVSSSVGHQLMDNHPYRDGRIKQANANIKTLFKALKNGDFNTFSKVCENEAMSLHALMMSSSPSYSLLVPETLQAIKRIKNFREEHHMPLTFTLDAGPNIHLIYPKDQSKVIVAFIEKYLKPLCENGDVIYDRILLK